MGLLEVGPVAARFGVRSVARLLGLRLRGRAVGRSRGLLAGVA